MCLHPAGKSLLPIVDESEPICQWHTGYWCSLSVPWNCCEVNMASMGDANNGDLETPGADQPPLHTIHTVHTQGTVWSTWLGGVGTQLLCCRRTEGAKSQLSVSCTVHSTARLGHAEESSDCRRAFVTVSSALSLWRDEIIPIYSTFLRLPPIGSNRSVYSEEKATCFSIKLI